MLARGKIARYPITQAPVTQLDRPAIITCLSAITSMRGAVHIAPVACTALITVTRFITRSLAILSASATSLTVQVAALLTMASATATSALRGFGMIMPVLSTSATALSNAIGAILPTTPSSTATAAPVLETGKIAHVSSTTTVSRGAWPISRQIMVACLGTISVTRAIDFALALAASTATVARLVWLHTISTSVHTAAMSSSVLTRVISIATSVYSTLTSWHEIEVARSIALTSATSLRLRTLKPVAMALATAMAVGRDLGIIRRVAALGTIDMQRAMTRLSRVAGHTGAAVARGASLVRSMASQSGVTASRRTAISAAVQAVTVSQLAVVIRSALTIAATSTIALATTLARLKMITVAVTSNVVIVRSLARTLIVTAMAKIGVVKALTHALQVAAASAVVVAAAHTFLAFIDVAATTGVAVARGMRKLLAVPAAASVVTNFVTIIVRYARRLIGSPSEAHITGQAAVITIIGQPSIIVGRVDMATHDPLDFLCGDTWQLTGPLLDGDGKPMNMTGAQVTWKLDALDGSSTILTKTIGSGVTVVDASKATILVTVTPAESTVVVPGEYRDYLSITLADGSSFTEWTGVIRAGAKPS